MRLSIKYAVTLIGALTASLAVANTTVVNASTPPLDEPGHSTSVASAPAQAVADPGVGTLATCDPTGTFCGEVTNGNASLVDIANGWCWSDKTRWVGETLPCKVAVRRLNRNQNSKAFFKDTDAFKAVWGCKTSWTINGTVGGFSDRRGKRVSEWIKVNNFQLAKISKVEC
jgi:hypothetical protein